MGAWGVGSFENDDAMDFAGSLSDLTAVESAFEALEREGVDYLQGPECSVAVAAAEVVAALGGRPAELLPEEVADWTRGRPAAAPRLVRRARAAVERVLAGSELRDLWGESDSWTEWSGRMADLKSRLG